MNKIVVIILVLGILFFGFLFAKERGYFENVSFGEEQVIKNNQEVAPVEQPNENFSGIRIDLPADFTLIFHREIPSSFIPFERELSRIEKKDPTEGWVEEMFNISQYLSKDDFDKALASLLNPPNKEELRIISNPPESYIVDNENGVHYVLSMYGNEGVRGPNNEILVNNHYISVPSKLAIISFENVPDFPDNVFTLEETQNIISLIKFGKPLVSEQKSPAEIAVINNATPANTQEFFGISLGLPAGVTVQSVANTRGSLSADTLKVNTIFVVINGGAGFPIEKSLSQADFDKTLIMIKDMDRKAGESGFTAFPPQNYMIDGEQATEYHQSMNGIDMYTIVVPSKLVGISFVLQMLSPYNLDGIHNLISSIKFNY